MLFLVLVAKFDNLLKLVTARLFHYILHGFLSVMMKYFVGSKLTFGVNFI